MLCLLFSEHRRLECEHVSAGCTIVPCAARVEWCVARDQTTGSIWYEPVRTDLWPCINPRQWRGGGVDATRPWVFLSCTPNRLEYHAKIFYSLWGVLCATFGEKNLVRSVQVTKLWRHKGNNLRQDFSEIVSKRNLAWCDWLEWG